VRSSAALGLVRACHPDACAAVTVMAAALAASTGRSPAGVVAVGAAVLAGQLSVGWHNDWWDAERDRQAGRADKPIAVGLVGRAEVGRAAVVAAVATVPLSFLSGWRAAVAHLVAVALAWSYNLRLKGTALSFVPYAASFPLLVAFVSLGRAGHPWPPWWALVTAALLGCGAHLVNAAPDLADDLAAGITGLPQRLGRRRSVLGAVGLLLAGTVVVAVGPGDPGWWALGAVAVAAAVVTGGSWLGRRPGARWSFRAALIVALVDVAALVARGNAI